MRSSGALIILATVAAVGAIGLIAWLVDRLWGRR